MGQNRPGEGNWRQTYLEWLDRAEEWRKNQGQASTSVCRPDMSQGGGGAIIFVNPLPGEGKLTETNEKERTVIRKHRKIISKWLSTLKKKGHALQDVSNFLLLQPFSA